MTEKLEEWRAFVVAHLHDPIEESVRADGTYLTSGDPGEVVVRLRGSAIAVFEYAVQWEDDYTPVVRPKRVGAVYCHRLPERAAMKAIQALIAGARESRLRRFRTCERCGRHQPPEWMEDESLCRSCAERNSEALH